MDLSSVPSSGKTLLRVKRPLKKPIDFKKSKPEDYDKLQTASFYKLGNGKNKAPLHKDVTDRLKLLDKTLKEGKILEKHELTEIKKLGSQLYEMGKLLTAINKKAPKQGVNKDTSKFLRKLNVDYKEHLERWVEAGAKPGFEKVPLKKDVKEALVGFNDLKEKIMNTTKSEQKKHLLEMSNLVRDFKAERKVETPLGIGTRLFIEGMGVTYNSLTTQVTYTNLITHGKKAKADLLIEDVFLRKKYVSEIPVPKMTENKERLSTLASHKKGKFASKNLIRNFIFPTAGNIYEHPDEDTRDFEHSIQTKQLINKGFAVKGYQIETYDGEDKLHCYIHEPKKMDDDAPLVLWFPGNADTAIGGRTWLDTSEKESMPCATFSYRGCGYSTTSEEVQKMSELTVKEDALAYVMALMDKFPNRKVVLVGHSLGGGLASAMAKVLVNDPHLRGRLKGLILTQSFNKFDSAAYTVGTFGRETLFWGTGLAAQGLIRTGWPKPSKKAKEINKKKLGGILKEDYFNSASNLKSLKKADVPILIIHAENDHMMSELGQKKLVKAGVGEGTLKEHEEKGSYVVLEGGNHATNSLDDPNAKSKIIKLITGKPYKFKREKSGAYHKYQRAAFYDRNIVYNRWDLGRNVEYLLPKLDKTLEDGDILHTSKEINKLEKTLKGENISQTHTPKEIEELKSELKELKSELDELGARLYEMGKLLTAISKTNPGLKDTKMYSREKYPDGIYPEHKYKKHLKAWVEAAAKTKFKKYPLIKKELVEFNKLKEDIKKNYLTGNVVKELDKMKKLVSDVKTASESEKVKPLRKGTLLLIEDMSVTYNSLKKDVDKRAEEIRILEEPQFGDDDSDVDSEFFPQIDPDAYPPGYFDTMPEVKK